MKPNTRVPVCLLAASCIALIFLNALSISAQTNPVLNLSDFGAVGDGVADDGPAFQSALDALADAGGGTLHVPAGRYLIQTPVIKDFSALNGGSVTIQGVPSDKEPAPPTAGGHLLAESLDLTSEIFPATGETQSAFTISNLNTFTVEHLAFTGNESVHTDAFITLFMSDIENATIFHTEFYGISTFGLVPELGGGNLIRAVRSDLNINQLMVLGSTANSGAYAPIVENIEWKGFHISNSIFIDFGIRSFFGKMGLGAPLSWINFASVAERTQESSRREVVIRDTFLDEGGWIGITAFPHLWGTPADPIDLIYISGLKMNVSNLGTAGNQFFDVANVLVENSIYGWSRNTGAALDFYRTDHAILDNLTCVLEADRIRADNRTERVTVINSEFGGLDSLAETTTVLETAPEEDPVQFVKQEFLSLLGREPSPAGHFYWSDLFIRCNGNPECLAAQRAEMEEYLNSNPQKHFSYGGIVTDEQGTPLSGIAVRLTGSQFANGFTDEQGRFKFLGLPTSGLYTVTVNDKHYTFTTPSHTFERPAHDVSVNFRARLNRHRISGRITRANGASIPGVTVNLIYSDTTSVVTDHDGNFSFSDLPAGEKYTIVPVTEDEFLVLPKNFVIDDLFSDVRANITGTFRPELLTLQESQDAIVFDSVLFLTQPLSRINPLNFGDDGRTRLMIFAKNMEHVTSTSQVKITAEDAAHLVYPMPVEFVANVPGLSWLKQINARVWPTLGDGKCVTIRVYVDGLESNRGLVCFAAAQSSP